MPQPRPALPHRPLGPPRPPRPRTAPGGGEALAGPLLARERGPSPPPAAAGQHLRRRLGLTHARAARGPSARARLRGSRQPPPRGREEGLAEASRVIRRVD